MTDSRHISLTQHIWEHHQLQPLNNRRWDWLVLEKCHHPSASWQLIFDMSRKNIDQQLNGGDKLGKFELLIFGMELWFLSKPQVTILFFCLVHKSSSSHFSFISRLLSFGAASSWRFSKEEFLISLLSSNYFKNMYVFDLTSDQITKNCVNKYIILTDVYIYSFLISF